MFKKKSDERLETKRLKMIRLLAFIQNLVIFGILLYQKIDQNVPAKEIFTLDNPLFVVFIIFVFPLFIIEQVIGTEDKDEDRESQKNIILLVIVSVIIFISGIYVLDPAVGTNGLLVAGIFGIFELIFAEVLNSVKQKNK